MDNETKKKINENYQRSLIKGERFWPDSIYKDLVVSLGIFIILVLLATFVGVPGEPKADPSDTSYLPRPEWYFLFLFKFLALFPRNSTQASSSLRLGINCNFSPPLDSKSS